MSEQQRKRRPRPLTDKDEVHKLELYADARDVPVNAWPALKQAVREGRAMHIDADSWFIDSATDEPIAPHPVIEQELKPGEPKPVREVMPELIEAAETYRRVGRPKAAAPKVHIGFRLAAEVVESIKASGPGYNARVEQALRGTFLRGTKAAKTTVVKGAKLSSKAAASASKRKAAAKSTASRKHAAKRTPAKRA